MIEAKSAADHIQHSIDRPDGSLQPVLYLLRLGVVKVQELGFALSNGVYITEKPIEVEVEALLLPLFKCFAHLTAGIRPIGTDLGQRQIALRELCAAAVHTIKDVDDDVDGFVPTGDLGDVELDLGDTQDRA